MLTAISDLFAIQKVRNPADLHLVPENFRTLSIQELMNERVQYLCTHSDPKIEDLRESVWGGHFTVHTFVMRVAEKIYLFDDEELFSNPTMFDYDSSIDGGVPLKKGYTVPENVRTIGASDYDSYEGGNFPFKELLQHPVVTELVPYPELRKSYRDCLEYLDQRFVFSEAGVGSIWTAPEMRPGFLRAYGLGFGGKAFYPQNPETKNHTLILKKRSS